MNEKENIMKKFAVAAALLSAVVATPALAADGGEARVEVRGGYVTGSGLDDATLGVAGGYDFDLGSTAFGGAEIAGDKVLIDGAKVQFSAGGRAGARIGANGKPELFKEGKVEFIDDGPGKPVGINRFIGRRPILAFGNSDGDLAMMRYTLSAPGRRLALLVHHDDNEREVAYDRDFRLSPLVEALDKADDYGITVVSVAKDWAEVFPPQA